MQEIILNKAKELVKLLNERNMTITFAESCTGGLCAANITRVDGASAVFKGSVVTYSEATKEKLAGVCPKTIEKYTVYSENCALEMSLGSKKLIGADMALALSGIAGPSGATKTDPVGTVYISLACESTHTCRRYVFDGDRGAVRSKAVLSAFEMAINYLTINEKEL